MRNIIQLVLRKKSLDSWYIFRCDVRDNQMLICRHPEATLMDLGQLAEARLEALTWLVLNASVLDEACEMVAAVLSRRPAEVIDVTVESEGTGRLQGIAQPPLYFRLECVESHSVNGVLETRVLATEGCSLATK